MRLVRLSSPGQGPSRYQTVDGRFEINQGANGVGAWLIEARAESDYWRLVAADAVRSFRRLRDARGWLEGSVYTVPHGWLHVDDESVRAVAEPMMREAVQR